MRVIAPGRRSGACEFPRYFNVLCLASCLLGVNQVSEKFYMARKLYIFRPVARVRTDMQTPAKWVGGYSGDYTFLGDYEARLLGVGNSPCMKRLPPWLHTAPANGPKFLKGGASRHDRDFRGWG